MQANRGFPRAFWLTLLGVLIAVAGFYAFLAGLLRVAHLLYPLFDRHPWLRPVPAILGAVAGMFSYLWVRRLRRAMEQ
jgi:hypothetical protein